MTALRSTLLACCCALGGLAQAQQDGTPDPLQREERYSSGAIKCRFRVDEQGRKHGAFTAWHENGQVAERAWFVADALDALRETYWPNGKLQRGESRTGGVLDGKAVERNAEATHEVRFPFIRGKLHGRVEIVDKGRVTGTQEWKDGVLVTLDGVVAHPKPKEAIDKTLAALYGGTDAHAAAAPDTPDGALCVLKAYRYLCDVPWSDLELDARMNVHAAAAAHICNLLGKLDHKPPNPGLTEAEYRVAFTGTSHSNLSAGSNLPGSVDSYMDDSDPSNIDRVGHRRWCLNPAMRKTGFGQDGHFSAMWSFDDSRTKVPEFEAVCYPPRGFVPKQYFDAGRAFSVHLNPNKYRAPDLASIAIAVTPLDERYLRAEAPLQLDFQKAQTSGAGVPFCVIFRPTGLVVETGRRYLVELTFQKEKPARQVLRWLVEFY